MDGIYFPKPFELTRELRPSWRRSLSALLVMLLAAAAAGAQPETFSPCAGARDEKAMLVGGEQASDVLGFGQSVIIEGTVRHGVVSLGGDVLVKGRVEGDVASVGGSVIQCAGSFIGGDVFVFGGAYHHGKTAPGRKPDSRTLMVAGYQEELRNLMRDPSQLLTPEWTLVYAGWRLLAVLFWFIVSLALTAIVPGAIGRAATRLQTTSLRVGVVGLLAAIVTGFGVPASLTILPPALGALVGILTLLLLVFAILFGRVVVIVATGRWLQRLCWPERSRSEVVALLLGTSFWTLILTLPYVWPFVTAAIIVASLGLSFTARAPTGWRRA